MRNRQCAEWICRFCTAEACCSKPLASPYSSVDLLIAAGGVILGEGIALGFAALREIGVSSLKPGPAVCAVVQLDEFELLPGRAIFGGAPS